MIGLSNPYSLVTGSDQSLARMVRRAARHRNRRVARHGVDRDESSWWRHPRARGCQSRPPGRAFASRIRFGELGLRRR